MDKRTQLRAVDPEMLLLPQEYDAALVGWIHRACQHPIAVYDESKLLQILVEDGASYEMALDYLGYNIKGNWQGEYTPAFLTLLDD